MFDVLIDVGVNTPSRTVRAMGARKEEGLLQITPWERSALQSLSEGKSAAQLALLFGMAEDQIERQLSALFSRMGAASPTDAVAVACRRGLIPAAPTPGASLL